ncbi:MAG: ABC-F family ATP-binding cassette domain-containing protein, partial [Bacteroidales bacterium]|nr:ABC-F family ATP-binding cassette domain-containing protein [Bacteroidales bacterium]
MAPLLDVQHLTKRFGALELLDDVSFSIHEGQKVALIARNGTGKSTLLDILTGREDYEEGSIIMRNGTRMGLLRQTPDYDPAMTVAEACFREAGELSSLIRRYEECLASPEQEGLDALITEMEQRDAWNFEQRAAQILSKLNIHDLKQTIGTLSGGQVKRVALANVLLADPDLLILDEPTNHLDLNMTLWLEKYLQHASCALLLVTHDRYFLDNVCSSILELDGKQLSVFRGNYAYYLEKKGENLTAAEAHHEKLQNLYRKELDWMRRMPCARGTKARSRKEAFAQLERDLQARRTERQARLEIKSGYIGSKIFEAEYVSKSFPDAVSEGGRKIILNKFYYNFSRYEKMGIIGGNGTGKSTFVKMLLGLERPDEGRFVVGETVRFGYYSQEGMAFDDRMKVIDAVRRIAETIDLGGGRQLTAMQFLTHFLFPPSRQQDYIAKLSGGERRRLYLCTVLMKNPNFLILDEPTNDLDIPTLQVLETYLQDFRGCVIVVSHDRYFMDKVVDHLLVFKGDGVIDDFPGNYTQYREFAAENEERERAERQAAPKPAPAKAEPARAERNASRPRRLSYKERQELDALEQEMAALEDEKKQIEAALCSGLLSVQELTEKSIRLPQIDQRLDEAM